MSADRLEAAFRESSPGGRVALVPFLTAGYPDADTTVATALALADAGAAALELGVPFSDPIADGPVIAATYQRALEKGTHLPEVLAIAARIRARSPIPIVLMTYANPVVRRGAEAFAAEAAAAGVDGVLLTDVPPEELPDLWAALRGKGLASILLVTPLTRAERIDSILAGARGYVYVVSRTGVTGSGQVAAGLDTMLQDLRARTRVPIAVGFGIDSPEHVRRFRGLADGLVVGTALLRRMGEAAPGKATEAALALFRDLHAAAL